MLFTDVFLCGVLVLCVALQVSHGQPLIPTHNPAMAGSSTETGDGLEIKNHPQHAPCFIDDVFTELREGVGDDGELTNHSLTLFGICATSENPSGSVLLEIARETKGLEVLHPAGVLLVEEDKREILELTFDLPQSPLLRSNPVLLLVIESPLTAGNLDVTFTSQSLQPNTQSVCISGGTQYIMLTGKVSEGTVHQKWRIPAATKSPDMKQNLKDIFIGEESGSGISVTPLLLFSGERGTDPGHVSGSSPASSQASSFLCELRRFLGDVMPLANPESRPLQLASLNSVHSLSLGPSSSETQLAGLINSSSPTVFSFTSRAALFQAHHGELAMSAALLEELRQRLEQTVVQIMEVIRQEEVGHRAVERLGRLKELSAFPNEEPPAGERQYRAFLLLKALQTVARTYEVQRALRATRAGPNNPVTGSRCGLRSLIVSLEKYLVSPNTANINNCRGSCAIPMLNPPNHAILLNDLIGNGGVDERGPCCVPLAYDALHVVNVNERSTELKPFADMVAKECGCR